MADDLSLTMAGPEIPADQPQPEVTQTPELPTSPLDAPTVARMSGYGWDEIDGHQASIRAQAEKFGYSQQELDAHLGYADPTVLGHDLQTSTRLNAAAAEEGAHPLEAASGGVLTPTSNPALPVKADALTADQRTSYADALTDGTTKGPQDFAQSFTDAVSDASGHDATPATAAIAAQLPHPNDITDYAIGIAQAAGLTNSFDTTQAEGMVKPGNLDPWNRPALQNPDGSYSTTSSISIGTDNGETLIPTVIDGKRLSNEDAIKHFEQTGENLGTFDTPDHADAYATALHNAQATQRDEHGNVKAVRQQVLNVWAQTGMTPKDIYDAVHAEPAFMAAMLNPPASPPITFPTLAELQAPGRDVIGHGGLVGAVMSPLEGLKGLGYLPQAEYENTAKVADLIKQALHPPADALEMDVPTAKDVFGQLMESPSIKLIASLLVGRAIGNGAEVLADSRAAATINDLMGDVRGGNYDRIAQRTQLAGELTTSALIRSTIRQETLPNALDGIIKETENPLTRVITETNSQAAKRVTAERAAMGAKLREIMGDTSYTKATAKQALEGYFGAVNQQVPGYLDWMKDYQGKIQTAAADKQAWIRGGGDPAAFSNADPTTDKPVLVTGDYHPLQVLYDHIMNRPGGGRVSEDDPLYPVADTISKLMAERVDTLHDLTKDGGSSFLKNYFPKLWTDSPIRVKQQFRDVYGPQTTTKEPSIPTIFDGIDRGLTPKFPNPIEGSLHFIQAVDDFAATKRAQAWMLEQKAAYKATSPRNDGDFLLKNTGNLYAPRGYAKVYNHWADNGFEKWPGWGGLYRKVLMAKNATLAMSLGLSGFHAVAISMQLGASYLGEALGGNLRRGEISKALGNVGLGAMTMTGVTQAIKYHKGYRMQNAYMDDPRATPLEKELVKIWKAAGGTAPSEGRGQAYFASQARNLFDDWKRAGSWNLNATERSIVKATGAVVGGVVGATLFGPAGAIPGAAIGRLAPVVPTLAKSTWNDIVKAIKGKKGETRAQHIAMPVPRFIEAIAGNFGRVADTLMAPLFDDFIPKIKMAVWADTMEAFLRRNPDAERAAVVRAGRQAMDSMDDRFGEMNLNNIFWNPYLKQLANCAFLSIGWEYGTWRASGRGLEDLILKPEGHRFTTRTNILLGVILQAGMAAGAYQYLMTGTGPSPMNLAGVAASGTPAGNIEIPFETKEFDRIYSLVVRAGNSPVKWLQLLPTYVLGKTQFGIAKDVELFLQDKGTGKLLGKLVANHMPIGVSTMTPNLPYVQTLMGIHSAPPEMGGAKQQYASGHGSSTPEGGNHPAPAHSGKQRAPTEQSSGAPPAVNHKASHGTTFKPPGSRGARGG